MNTFILFLLIGFASGIIVLPIFMFFFNLIRNTLERRKVKRMINQGQFLITIDPRDYDSKAWEKEIDPTKYKEDLVNLNQHIFKK